MSLEINNQKDFYENIVVEDNGSVLVDLTSKVGETTKSLNQYDFFQKVKLNDNGVLSIVIV